MNIITTIAGLEYGGKYHKFFWDIKVNPLASIANGLADCTTFVVGAVLQAGLPCPVSKFPSARNWHKYLTNGWTKIDFDIKKVKVGDVVEWSGDGNHVAIISKIVDGVPYVSSSSYTGIHGKAYWNGKYDTRDGINSLKELSDLMISKYEYRFFHCITLEKEIAWCSGLKPTYILVAPSFVKPVERNENVDQIEVTTSTLRMRSTPEELKDLSNYLGAFCPMGFFNVLEKKKNGNYTWYRIDDSVWVAGVKEVNFLAKTKDELTILRQENEELKTRLEKIRKAGGWNE